MTSVLAILILSSSFSVAIEVEGGFVERSFANTKEGVTEFDAFSEAELARHEQNYKVCVIAPSGEQGAVVDWLLQNDVRPALLSRAAYAGYVSKSGAPSGSAVTAARACIEAFPFIRGRS